MRGFIVRQFVISGIVVFLYLHPQSVPAGGHVCFRGKPLPECSAFLITEIGIGYMGSDGGRVWPESEIGMMFNVSEDYAVGITGFLAYVKDGRGGVRLRLRRWLRPNLSVNLSGGLRFANFTTTFPWDADEEKEHPGFTGHVDLNYEDIVALYLGSEIVRGGPLDGANWHVGIRCGSYLGVAVQAAGATLLLLALIAVGPGK